MGLIKVRNCYSKYVGLIKVRNCYSKYGKYMRLIKI